MSFEDFRNHIAHSVWVHAADYGTDQAQSLIVGRKKNSSFQINTKTWSSEDISEQINDGKEAAAYLSMLVARIALEATSPLPTVTAQKEHPFEHFPQP